MFSIPVKQCFKPPPERMIRKTDEIFLKKLAKSMSEDPYGHGGAAVVLLCSTVMKKEHFKLDKKGGYR